MNNSRKRFLSSVVVLALCITMFIGTTFAWFTDNVTSSGNIIKSGNLDIEMYWTDDLDRGTWYNVEDPEHNTIFGYDKWEPGYTEVRYIKIVNNGTLALNYDLTLTPQNGVGKLAEVINVYFADEEVEVQNREDLNKLGAIGLLNNVLDGGATASGTLLPENQSSPLHKSGETIVTMAMNMITTAGNDYQEESVGDFTITALATQAPYEQDSFGSNYDANAEMPVILTPGKVSANVTPDNGKVPTGGVNLSGEGISAFVPAGVAMKDGASKLTLSVTPLKNTTSDITVVNNEVLIPVDVHIEGVAEDNTVPIVIELGEVLPKYMNMGNYHLFHVEDGTTSQMTLVNDASELTTHNTFTYDPLTGKVSVAMASFSEVALVADTENGWEGNYDYNWYLNRSIEYTIANADQLAAFGKIVGGMADGIERDSFTGETIKLISNINLADGETKNNGVNKVFHPIGYYYQDGDSTVKPFEGTFDGNGHIISGFYQNTWEINGDYDAGYYKDGMGLFGYIVNGTVKNLTVDNFSSDGEFTPTGVIASYAVNSTFENIAITNCNPRVYNTGNAGIVGIGGNSDDSSDKKMTYSNITIDNSNKISALWGSYDVACGGIMGMFRGNSLVVFDECHVAAQMDVYNDVCGNYQYYWYRYSGMMIGSIRGKNIEEGGYTVPDTTGITASNCTVHYGDWNDYYYCELVANTIASYTHDHQFSRLEQVDAVDITDMKYTVGDSIKDIPTSGKYNYVIVPNKKMPEEGVVCYHFVDGKQWKHEDAGKETINGQEILKEDKQHVFLPFDQLFQGDGWGVKHIALGEFDGITILPREFADSVVKFEKADKLPHESYPEGYTIELGELFKAVPNPDVAIRNDKVKAFVSPSKENSNVTADYKQNATDWTKSTLTFKGQGSAKITITDYYFCKEITIDINIGEVEAINNFAVSFPNYKEYIYRVGNKNTVEYGSLFKKNGAVTILDETVSIENIEGNATGTSIENNTDWTKGTIQFEGTGVVKVSISDTNKCIPTELYLEVVDATNVTEYSQLKNYNATSVLLDNIIMKDNGSLYLNGGAVLYGNGFTFDCTKGAYTASGSVSENYVIALVDAHLDNVEILGKVYTQYGAQASNDYNRALVVSKGNSTITNCYLSNTASPVRLVEGSLTIKGSTVKGGNFANIDVRNGHLVIEDVTTINQTLGNDKSDNGSTVIGLGIVIFYENVDSALTSIDIKGTLTQYNNISSNDKFSHDYATQFVNEMMTGNYDEFRTEIGEVKWVNAGIISLTDGIIPIDNRTNKGDYIGKAVSFINRNGYVYSVRPTSASVEEKTSEYKTLGQGVIAPTYSFDYTNKNYIAKTDGSNDYCYAENGKVLIAMDQGDTFEWDPFILTATKFGKTFDYTVSMKGTTYETGSKIAFNTSGDYKVTYTYIDDGNYVLNEDGELDTKKKTYTKTVSISVSVIKPLAQHAVFTFADTNTATEKVTVNDKTYISAVDVSATDKEWGYITVNGTKIFYPITEAQMKKNTWGTEVQVYYYVFKDAITITDYKDGGTGGEQTYNGETTTMPSNLAVVNGMEAKYTAISSACVDISKLTKDGPSGEVWDFSASTTVSGTTIYNKYLAHSSPSGLAIKSGTRDYDAITVAQFSYTDAAGATYYYFVGYFMPNQVSGDNCVTPDTLITLADGSQVRVDSLTGSEQLLIWNMETGSLDSAPIMFVDNDSEATYEVIKLYFSDGTEVKVISEHGFWDYDLNKYVYLDRNAAQYIGHTFAKQNGDVLDKVELVDVVLEDQVTTAWSPVTAGHLCYFVNDMLSMPGGVGGLFNIFDVDAETMTYDYEAMARDIETYGLFTYEELSQYAELSKEMFDAAGGKYLKVSIGKGNLTEKELIEMIERYGKFFK